MTPLMWFADRNFLIDLPEPKEGGVKMTLPKRTIDLDEEIESWCGIPIGQEAFLWIETGWTTKKRQAIVKVTLYLPALLWRAHAIDLAIGENRPVSKYVLIARMTLDAFTRRMYWGEEGKVIKSIKAKWAAEFVYSTRYIKTTLPSFIIDEAFWGIENVERAVLAARSVPKMGFEFEASEVVYRLYLKMGPKLENRDFYKILCVVNTYQRIYCLEDLSTYWRNLRREACIEEFIDEISSLFGMVRSFWHGDWVPLEEILG